MRQRTSSLFAWFVLTLAGSPGWAKDCKVGLGAVVTTETSAVDPAITARLALHAVPADRLQAAEEYLADTELRLRRSPLESVPMRSTEARDALTLVVLRSTKLTPREKLETLEGLRQFFEGIGVVVVTPDAGPTGGVFHPPTFSTNPRIYLTLYPSLDGAVTLHHEIRHAMDFERLLRRYRAAHPSVSRLQAIEQLEFSSPAAARWYEDRALRNGILATAENATYGIEMQIRAMGQRGDFAGLQPGTDAYETLLRLFEEHAATRAHEVTPLTSELSPLRAELLRPRTEEAPPGTFRERAPHLVHFATHADGEWMEAVETLYRERMLPRLRAQHQRWARRQTLALGLPEQTPPLTHLLRDTARWWLTSTPGRHNEAPTLVSLRRELEGVYHLRSLTPRGVLRRLANRDDLPWADYRRAVEATLREISMTAVERSALLPVLLSMGMDRCPDLGRLALDDAPSRNAYLLALRGAIEEGRVNENPRFERQFAAVRNAPELLLLERSFGRHADGADIDWLRTLARWRGR